MGGAAGRHLRVTRAGPGAVGAGGVAVTCPLLPAGDEPNQSHEIFKLYRDPCRVGPKQDEPWAMGRT